MKVLKRRELLRGLGLLPLLAACSPREPRALQAAAPQAPVGSARKPASSPMPVIFAAHGAPVLLDDAPWTGELRAWAQALPRPRSVLMISAHWEQRPAALGATRPVPLVHDFYGFPERYYQVRYPSPGAPELAARVRALLAARGIAVASDPQRGLDHGAYVPLAAMYPDADVPVLQLSLPALSARPALAARELFALGQALAPLREEGALIVGSGFLTHNMSYAARAGTPQWAREFDAWAEDALARFDVDALLDFQARAPAASLALPTWEHYAPVLVAAGAAADGAHRATFPITGWWMDGAFTKRSVQLG